MPAHLKRAHCGGQTLPLACQLGGLRPGGARLLARVPGGRRRSQLGGARGNAGLFQGNHLRREHLRVWCEGVKRMVASHVQSRKAVELERCRYPMSVVPGVQ